MVWLCVWIQSQPSDCLNVIPEYRAKSVTLHSSYLGGAGSIWNWSWRMGSLRQLKWHLVTFFKWKRSKDVGFGPHRLQIWFPTSGFFARVTPKHTTCFSHFLLQSNSTILKNSGFRFRGSGPTGALCPSESGQRSGAPTPNPGGSEFYGQGTSYSRLSFVCFNFMIFSAGPKGPIYKGHVGLSRFACKFVCKCFDVAPVWTLPIYCSKFHILHAHVARCSASYVNGACRKDEATWGKDPAGPEVDFCLCFFCRSAELQGARVQTAAHLAARPQEGRESHQGTIRGTRRHRQERLSR